MNNSRRHIALCHYVFDKTYVKMQLKQGLQRHTAHPIMNHLIFSVFHIIVDVNIWALQRFALHSL